MGIGQRPQVQILRDWQRQLASITFHLGTAEEDNIEQLTQGINLAESIATILKHRRTLAVERRNHAEESTPIRPPHRAERERPRLTARTDETRD